MHRGRVATHCGPRSGPGSGKEEKKIRDGLSRFSSTLISTSGAPYVRNSTKAGLGRGENRFDPLLRFSAFFLHEGSVRFIRPVVERFFVTEPLADLFEPSRNMRPFIP